MSNLNKQSKRIDWLYVSLIIFLLLIFFVFCYLIGNKQNSSQHNFISSFAETGGEETGDEQKPGWIQGVIDGLFENIKTLLNGLLSGWLRSLLIVPILKFLSVFTLIIYQLTGGSLLQSTVSGGEDGQTYLFFQVPKMFLFVSIISAIVFLIVLTVNMLVILYSPKTDNARLKQTMLNTFVSLFLFCALPVAFLLLMIFFNTIMDLFNKGINMATGSSGFQYAIPDAIANLGLSEKHVFTGTGDTRYQFVLNASNYDAIFPTLCCALFLFGYAIMAATIIQQLFQLMVLYLWSPMALINYSNDDGQTFKAWFQQFRNKLITNFSIILGVQIYGYINPMILKFTENLSTDTTVVLFLQVTTLLGGLMFLMGFPTFVGQFTGESFNTRDSQNMISSIGRKAMRMSPTGRLASKAMKMKNNTMSAQVKKAAKSKMIDNRASKRAAIMQMKGRSGTSYKKHEAWVDKQIDKLNRKQGGIK